jgi:hypothetical protein
MILAGIFAMIVEDADIVALIGSPSTRKDKTKGLFPVVAPQESDLPQIIFTQISGNTVAMMQGPAKLQPMRMQFSCYAQTYEEAKALARALKKLLVGFNGSFIDGTRIDYCSLALELDGYEEAASLFNVPIDLEFLYADTNGA